jgi:serpin B
VLVNAIYFYGVWEYQFEKRYTKDGDFFRLDGMRALAKFMRLRESLPYMKGDGFQVIEFPYFGSQFAMTVILPDDGQFARIESRLDRALLDGAIDTLRDQMVSVFLPKSEFEFATGLVGPLMALGMTDAFDLHSANFSGMLDAPDTGFLSQVLHKAFINVDEDGTEAAGATISIRSFGGSPDEPVEVRIDRPFIFLIRATQTGAILFIGRVMDPSA